ncbi:MAG: alpha-2-macroglobulin family protein, partial [Chthoniobacteraceae bacterium]
TGPLEWRLGRVPPEKLLAVNSRLREFTVEQTDPVTSEDVVDSATGFPKWTKTELLIDACRLEIVADGKIDAGAAESDTRRDIAWKPDKGLPSGSYVLEVTGKNAEGKIIGNRALITFTEYVAAQKQFGNTRLVHVVNIGDGSAVPGVRIRAVNSSNEYVADALTDHNGTASFSLGALFSTKAEKAERFLIETPDGPSLQPVNAVQYQGSGYSNFHPEEETKATQYRMIITTDRPICRPGQTVKFKGFVREVAANGELRIPHVRAATWTIGSGDDDELAKGSVKLDDYGGMDGEWKIPATAKVAQHTLTLAFEGTTCTDNFDVQEFRPPPFTVSLEDMKLPGAQSGARISSAYFHGAPNAGGHVKWTAVWSGNSNGDDTIIVTDKPRVASVQKDRQLTVKGEGTLGADGSLEVKTSPPFTDNIQRGWYTVQWNAEVTALDGQTITETGNFPVYGVPVQLSVQGNQVAKAADAPATNSPALAITIKADSMGSDTKPVAGTPLSVEIYQVINKTVKEQISPNVYRYRNSVSFEKGDSFSGNAPFEKDIPVKAAGEYLLVVRDPENPAIPVVAQRAYVSGPGEAEFPVKDEESIGVTCDKPGDASDPKKTYAPGEKAVISVQSPFPGTAWVTVEAETILDTFIIPLDSNSSRIEIPVKKEYAPNAWVTVHLVRRAGEETLPAERFGAVPLTIRRPDLELKVAPVFAAKQVRPKESVSGEIVVTSEDKPVPNADLTVYAVDESVLDAGDWHEPALRPTMYPDRVWSVGTFHGMEQLSLGVDTASLHQKGFIIGAGDPVSKAVVSEARPLELRTNFPPLAYWQTHIVTDKNGKAPFSFKAPDSLTRYKVIVLAQTKQSQFGTGSGSVTVAKPVQVEPALPRFLRVGDEVELRAIVRQTIADELPVTLRCTTGLKLTGEPAQTQNVKRGLPAIFRFKATVGEGISVPVRFETDAGPGDAVEITLPVNPATLLRKEAVFGMAGEVQKQIPPDWLKATGTAEETFSTSPWLPKLAGLPLVLEYPHGCFEQITSRILCYTQLQSLLDYLPEPATREQDYKKRIENGIERMAGNLTAQGFLPYWPGGESHPLPTVAGYWAARDAAAHGVAVPARLKDSLAKATRSIALAEKNTPNDPYTRAFALMVLSTEKDTKTYTPVIREMYSRREKLDDEQRALLAIAMHRFGIMAAEQQQLLKEIDQPLAERAFDPEDFSSTDRAEAIRALAFAIIDPAGTSGKAREGLIKRIDDLLDSARTLSTQENFWLLMAFNALHAEQQGAPVDFHKAAPVATAVSRNGASAIWSGLDVRHLQDFAVRMEKGDSLHCLIEAQYLSDSPVTNRTDRGFRVERVVKNLTDNARTGSSESPYRLGDQILVTYRLVTPKLQHFVALTDELPAALETINPDIASIARTYSVPEEKGAPQLSLSYSEMRDKVTALYFDRVEPGAAVYSVLARVTCAGTFHWPATQVEPMYDSRFSGLSPSSVCHVIGD